MAISAVVVVALLCYWGRHLSDAQKNAESQAGTGIMLMLAGLFFLSQRKAESENRQKKVALGAMTHDQAKQQNRIFSQLAWSLTAVGLAWTGYMIFWVYGITNIINGLTDYFS